MWKKWISHFTLMSFLAFIVMPAPSAYAVTCADLGDAASGGFVCTDNAEGMNVSTLRDVNLDIANFDFAAGTKNIFDLSLGNFTANVIGSNPTLIGGRFEIQNGILSIFNSNGVHILSTADFKFENGSLLAAAGSMNKITGKIDATGFVLNEGSFHGQGDLALIGKGVENKGTVNLPANRVFLTGGKAITVGLSGDNLVSVVVDEGLGEGDEVKDFNGNRLSDQIKNTGGITAHKITLDAKGVDSVFEKAINLKGELKAVDVDVNRRGELVMLALDDIYSKAILEATNIEIHSAMDVATMGVMRADAMEEAARSFQIGGVYEVKHAHHDNLDHAITYAANTSVSGSVDDVQNIVVNSGVVLTLTGDTTLTADSDADGTGAVLMASGSSVVGGGHNLTIKASQNSTLGAVSGVNIFDLQESLAASNPTFTSDPTSNNWTNITDFRITSGKLNRFTGSGTGGSPYQIYDVYGVQAMKGFSTDYFKLHNDIDAYGASTWNAGWGFDPIATFNGSLDGQGYVIDGLSISYTGADPTGLFASLGGSVSNLGLTNVDVSGEGNVGALAGYSNGQVEQVFVTGEVSGQNSVGGLVGNLHAGGSIANAYSAAHVTGTGQDAGGLVGYIYQGSILNSFASGNVDGGTNVGGLVGYFQSGSVSWEIRNSFSTGTVTGSFQYQGLVGLSYVGDASHVVDSYYTDTNYGANGNYEAGGADAFHGNSHAVYSTWSFAEGSLRWNSFSDALPHLDYEWATSITNLLQLQNMNLNLAGYYSLANDIDASRTQFWNSGTGFNPVGSGAAKFMGEFDGNGHAIDGLYINRPADDDIGLFGYVDGASNNFISDVSLTNADISGNSNVGALIGTLDSSIVFGVSAAGVLNGAGSNIGGLIGYSIGSDISESSADIDVTAGNGTSEIGGFVGKSSGIGNITHSYSLGSVAAGDDAANVGGFIGWNENSDISDSYSLGNVQAGESGSVVGGFVGYNHNTAEILRAYTTGNVLVGDNSELIGGFAGYNHHDAHIDQAYSTGSVEAGASANKVAGFVGFNSYVLGVADSSGYVTNSYTRSNVTVGDNSREIAGFAANNWGSYMHHNLADNEISYGAGTTEIGGMIGWNASATWSNYWNASRNPGLTDDIYGDNASTFTQLTSEQMKDSANFADFDFDTIWAATGDSQIDLRMEYNVWNGTGNWSDAANWTKGALTSLSKVLFNSTSTGNSTVNAGFAGTIAKILIDSNYTGTITQNRSLNVTGGYVQKGGTFNSNGQLFTAGGTANIQNAVFNGSTGTNTFSGGLDLTGASVSTTGSGSIVLGGDVRTRASSSASSIGGNLDLGGVSRSFTVDDGSAAMDLEIAAVMTNGNFVKAGAGKAAQSGNTSYSGTVSVNAGDYDANGFTTVSIGLLTVSGGTYTAGSGAQTYDGGLTVSSGTYNASSAAVDVNGNVALSGGALNGNTANISVSGNWNKTGGTFNAGTGTILFDAGTGITQTLNAGASAGSFNNLTHSGAGTLQLVTNNLAAGGTITNSAGTFDSNGLDVSAGGLAVSGGTYLGSTGALDVNGNVALSGGTLTAPSGSFTVSGNWNKTGGTFNAGTGTVTLDGAGAQTLTAGGSDFYNLTHSGSGTVTQSGALNVTHNFSNSAGTFVSPIASSFAAGNSFSLSGGAFDRFGGAGNSGSPYLIYDIYGLQGMAGHLGAYYELANNIDASSTLNWNSGQGFKPVGDSSARFTGSFDGNNHIIDNLFIDRTTDYIGLFGAVQNAVIRDAGLTDIDITGGTNVGGLAGRTDSSSISNVYTTGAIYSGDDKESAGGLIGHSIGASTIQNVHSSVSVNVGSGFQSAGGLVGKNQLGSSILDSYSTGTLTVDGSIAGAGGLVGYNPGGIIRRSYSTSDISVSGAGTYIGGLVGNNSPDALIEYSYALGNVIVGASSQAIGGFIGLNYDNSDVLYSYSKGNVTAGANAEDVGGFAGKNAGAGTGGTEANIWYSYTTGNVTVGSNSNSVGGFVGENWSAVIAQAYADNVISLGSGTVNFGGFVGPNAATSNYVAWNIEKNPTLTGDMYGNTEGNAAGMTSYINRLTTAQMKDSSLFKAIGWDFETVWASTGGSAPDLRWEYNVWQGPADGNWSDASNWTKGSLTSASKVLFNATSTANALINSGFAGSVAKVLIDNGYTGTITQSRNLNVSGDFMQKAGAFESGSYSLTVGGLKTVPPPPVQQQTQVTQQVQNAVNQATSVIVNVSNTGNVESSSSGSSGSGSSNSSSITNALSNAGNAGGSGSSVSIVDVSNIQQAPDQRLNDISIALGGGAGNGGTPVIILPPQNNTNSSGSNTSTGSGGSVSTGNSAGSSSGSGSANSQHNSGSQSNSGNVNNNSNQSSGTSISDDSNSRSNVNSQNQSNSSSSGSSTQSNSSSSSSSSSQSNDSGSGTAAQSGDDEDAEAKRKKTEQSQQGETQNSSADQSQSGAGSQNQNNGNASQSDHSGSQNNGGGNSNISQADQNSKTSAGEPVQSNSNANMGANSNSANNAQVSQTNESQNAGNQTGSQNNQSQSGSESQNQNNGNASQSNNTGSQNNGGGNSNISQADQNSKTGAGEPVQSNSNANTGANSDSANNAQVSQTNESQNANSQNSGQNNQSQSGAGSQNQNNGNTNQSNQSGSQSNGSAQSSNSQSSSASDVNQQAQQAGGNANSAQNDSNSSNQSGTVQQANAGEQSVNHSQNAGLNDAHTSGGSSSQNPDNTSSTANNAQSAAGSSAQTGAGNSSQNSAGSQKTVPTQTEQNQNSGTQESVTVTQVLDELFKESLADIQQGTGASSAGNSQTGNSSAGSDGVVSANSNAKESSEVKKSENSEPGSDSSTASTAARKPQTTAQAMDASLSARPVQEFVSEMLRVVESNVQGAAPIRIETGVAHFQADMKEVFKEQNRGVEDFQKMIFSMQTKPLSQRADRINQTADTQMILAKVVGDVRIVAEDGSVYEAEPDKPLKRGDQIWTSGEGEAQIITPENGEMVEVAANSAVSLDREVPVSPALVAADSQPANQTQPAENLLTLAFGKMSVAVSEAKGESSFRVQSPTGVSGLLG